MSWTIENVRAGEESALAAIRELWTAYWSSLSLTPCFQGFAEELRGLPGKYAAPGGRLLLGRVDGISAAAAAFRPLDGESCEAKRLYVHPDFRRRGLARAMMLALIEEARSCGYRIIRGDTLPVMAAAMDLYRELGFVETGPYTADPTPGAIYLRLDL